MQGIQGIDKIIFSEIPASGTFLVEGDTGVLKTTFVLESVRTSLEQKDEVCLYLSLKEDTATLVQRAGIDKLYAEKRFHVLDYDGLMERFSPGKLKSNPFQETIKIIRQFKEKYGERFTHFAIDPINILISSFHVQDVRSILYHFFSYLSDNGTRNWIVYESEDGNKESFHQPYHFLADGIISLGMLEANDVIRYIEISKMRGVNHSLKKFQVSFKKEGFRILGSAYDA